jgi:5-methylcytosine-specific restriction endonuclease McrA
MSNLYNPFYIRPKPINYLLTSFMDIDYELSIAEGKNYRRAPWYTYWQVEERPPRKKSLIPSELRWAVWERDDFTCQRCRSRQHLSIDHVKPESRGGLTVMENLQTLCRRCNSRKGARHGF